MYLLCITCIFCVEHLFLWWVGPVSFCKCLCNALHNLDVYWKIGLQFMVWIPFFGLFETVTSCFEDICLMACVKFWSVISSDLFYPDRVFVLISRFLAYIWFLRVLFLSEINFAIKVTQWASYFLYGIKYYLI